MGARRLSLAPKTYTRSERLCEKAERIPRIGVDLLGRARPKGFSTIRTTLEKLGVEAAAEILVGDFCFRVWRRFEVAVDLPEVRRLLVEAHEV